MFARSHGIKTNLKTFTTALALTTALTVGGLVYGQSATAADLPIPSGTYAVDPTHASVIWKVRHLGLADYTARFNTLDATLEFNAEDPAASSVDVTIDPASVDTDYPNAEQKDFNAELRGEQFFNTGEFPAITFKSTSIDITGDNTGTITGDLTLLGVTKPVTLDVTMNGYLEEHPFTKDAALGFSGTTTVKRSEFGLDYGVPYVGDDVKVLIEAEFNRVP